MKNLILILCSLFCFSTVEAQDEKTIQVSDEEAVQAVIQAMFDGMRAGDSTMVRNCFVDSPTLQTTYTNKEGKAGLHTGDLNEFCNAVGTPHDEVWDEKIWSYEIKVDDRLASAWTEYTFYAGDKLSHCGVNSFLLFKSDDGWKILNIVDTRRRKDCKE